MSDVMTREIQGAKAGQKQPQRPSIADDTIASISRLKIMYGLSEGEVKGLVNGGASIKLEGTPLLDADGNPNFEGVEWEIRHGTVDQPHIAGMPSASNEIGVNTALSSTTPYIRSINNTQLSSVNVNISFPLLKSVTDKGDVVGATVAYAIDVQTDGFGYVTMLDTSITAKTSGRYQRTHNIKLPDAQSGWQIRVRKITADGNNETLFNAMQIDSIAEIIDAKLRYPCTAHLYLSFDAKTFSNIPKISVHMHGVYVQIPVNYDPVNKTSQGIWNGQFKLGYTKNPAWHYYNLITNDRYGLGDKLQDFMIDKWALENIARICDQKVSDGNGGLEPRFECNLYLQKSEDAYQVLQHIAGIFRGMSYWNGSKIFVDADTPRDCEYVITRANVIGGHFSKTGSAASDRHTIAQVAYSNPANGYDTEYAMVRDEQAIAKFGINILDLAAVGCTSEGQAYRMGKAALLAEQNRTQTVSFAMGLDGSLPTVGSRVDIADLMFKGNNTGGRISAVSTNRRIITVDRDNVPVKSGDQLIVNLESGKAQTRTVASINGRAITVSQPFDLVASQNVWAINTIDLPTMPFIVMSVTANEDNTQYNYTCMQYDPAIYAQIDNSTIVTQKPPPSQSVDPYVIEAPAYVTLDSRYKVSQGIAVTTLIITWAQVKNAVAYDVEYRKDDGDWLRLNRTGNISSEVDNIIAGKYQARVSSISTFNAISKPTLSAVTTIAAKNEVPSTVLALTVRGILFGMHLSWSFGSNSEDTNYTEIQAASFPDTNPVELGTYAYPTDSVTINGLGPDFIQYYRARTVDKLGNESAWTDWVEGQSSSDAQAALDLLAGQISKTQLAQDMVTAIDKIEVNELSISAETQDRIADILDANSKITAEQQARVAGLLAANEGITTETAQRKVADVAINSRVDTVVSKTDGNTAAIASEVTARTDADSALSTRIDTVVSKSNNNEAAITSEVTARTNADTALSGRIDTVSSKTDTNTATITTVNNTLTNQLGSQAEQINAIKADYQPEYFDKTKYLSSTAEQWTYAKSVARDNYALSQKTELVSAKVDVNDAKYTREITTLATNTEAITKDVQQISAKTADNLALINSESVTRADQFGSLSTQVTQISAKAQSALDKGLANTGLIQQESTARADQYGSIVQQTQTLQTIAQDADDRSKTNKTSIQQHTQSIDGLMGQWTLKMDVSNRISGIGLVAYSNVSAFNIRADQFYISNPDDPNYKDVGFIYQSGNKLDPETGQVTPQGLYLKAAFIKEASITTAKIRGQAVTIMASVYQQVTSGSTTPIYSYTTPSLYLNSGGSQVLVRINMFSFDTKGQITVTFLKDGGDPKVFTFRKNGWGMGSLTENIEFIVNGSYANSNYQVRIESQGDGFLCAAYTFTATVLKR